MYYKLKANSFFRNYNNIGYIVNIPNNSDRVVNESGALFLSLLSYKAQSLKELSNIALNKFVNVSLIELQNDMKDFYDRFYFEDFLIRGESEEECNNLEKISISNATIKNQFNSYEMQNNIGTQEFLEKYFAKNPKLLNFQIELTSKCNERCIHCYIPHEDKLYNIDDNLYFQTIKQLKDIGIISISLSGGEPMLHPNFLEFLKYAQDSDFYVKVFTNLTLLNEEIIKQMKNNRTSVYVSLYSMNEVNHDAITQMKGSFNKTKSNILKLIENNIPVYINCPIMDYNKNDYNEVYKWAKDLNLEVRVDYDIMARCDLTTDNLEHRLKTKEMEDIIINILDNNKENQKQTASKELNKDKEYTSDRDLCGACITSCCIDAKGNVYPCTGWNYNCGNLNETSLKDIWEKSPQMLYIRSLNRKDFNKCVDCKDIDYCFMCMAKNANESKTGNPLEINNHFCDVARMNRQVIENWRKKNL